MVWAGFGNVGKTNLAFPTGQMKANGLQDLLDTHLLPFGKVYADGKQCTNITELKSVIIFSWENIEISTLQKLVGSMCDRAFKVVLEQGSFAGY
jgi:hypothetical protein